MSGFDAIAMQPADLRVLEPLPAAPPGGNRPEGASAEARTRRALRSAADEVVGQLFFGTLLEQLRSSSLKGKYGHGGRGEAAFLPQLHQHFAAQAGRANRTDLADEIVERFEHRAIAMRSFKEQCRRNRNAALRELDMDGKLGTEAGFDYADE